MTKNTVLDFTTTCNNIIDNIKNSLYKKNTLYNVSEQILLTSNVHKFIEFILHFTNNNKKCETTLTTLSLYIIHILKELQNKILNSDIILGQSILNCADEIHDLIIMELNKN